MEKGYFSAAWGDITKSPGWFSKILRMGLLCLIPIFGLLVVYGYLYGWARDIAWNVHRPMPDKIFGNEDGNLYKRGFFILVIGFVFSLIPGVFSFISSMVTGASFAGAITSSSAPFGVVSVLMGLIFSLAGLVLSFAVVFFYWVGAMRCALYGTLSSGFQIGKIWAMLRYDFTGLLRIFGMSLICYAIVGVAAFVVVMLMVLLGTIFGVAFVQTEAQAVAFVLVILFLILLACVVSLFVFVLIIALICRALGYWTRQFQVNLWGGQEDPMPFELEFARRSQQQYSAYTTGTGMGTGQTNQAGNYQQNQPFQGYQAGQPNQGYQAGQPNQGYQEGQPNQQGRPWQSGQAYQPSQPWQSGQTYQSSKPFQSSQPNQQAQGYYSGKPFQQIQRNQDEGDQPPIIDVEPIKSDDHASMDAVASLDEDKVNLTDASQTDDQSKSGQQAAEQETSEAEDGKSRYVTNSELEDNSAVNHVADDGANEKKSDEKRDSE